MTFNGILSFKGLFDNDDGGKGRLMEKKKIQIRYISVFALIASYDVEYNFSSPAKKA